MQGEDEGFLSCQTKQRAVLKTENHSFSFDINSHRNLIETYKLNCL